MLYANTTAFYMRDLSILRLWYQLYGSRNQSPYCVIISIEKVVVI